MTTIKLKNIRGSLIGPLRTQDARHGDDAAAVDRILIGIKNSLGVLSDDDVERIEAILQKYTGGSSTVNGLGAARAGDAADAGRAAAAKVRAQVEQIQGIAKNYKSFWDRNAKENAAAIRR
jgi:hypothetical protein